MDGNPDIFLVTASVRESNWITFYLKKKEQQLEKIFHVSISTEMSEVPDMQW